MVASQWTTWCSLQAPAQVSSLFRNKCNASTTSKCIVTVNTLVLPSSSTWKCCHEEPRAAVMRATPKAEQKLAQVSSRSIYHLFNDYGWFIEIYKYVYPMSIVSGVQLDKLPIVLDILNGAGSLDNVQNSKALSPVIKSTALQSQLSRNLKMSCRSFHSVIKILWLSWEWSLLPANSHGCTMCQH